MENINIKVILDEVFGKSCNTSNNIACDTCKYKEDCNLLNKFINVSDDEIYAELKRRKANKSTK